MKKQFYIFVTSPPDREKLVAEIWYGTEGKGYSSPEEALSNPVSLSREMVAELNQESGDLQVELYARRSGEPWTFSCEEFLEAMNRAKQRLVGPE